MKELESVNLDKFRKTIIFSNSIVIISHTRPDGDAIGSALGLYDACYSVGANPIVVLPDEFPSYYNFIPRTEEIIVATENEVKAKQVISDADVIICADFNSFSRVDFLEETLKNATGKRILIDHHQNPDTRLFDLVFSDPSASSTSELAYWISTNALGTDCISLKGAIALYTGICTDTGSFSYSCNSPTVYMAVAHLVKRGIEVSEVQNQISNTYTENRLRLLGFCIDQRLKIIPELKFAYFYVSKADNDLFSAEKGDLEGVVNYTLKMSNIEIGALVKEGSDGKIRISFRSKYDFDVNKFAAKYFDGGGHIKAAGASSERNLMDTCRYMEDCLRLELSTDENK